MEDPIEVDLPFGAEIPFPLEKQRKGFILTNGSGCYIVSQKQKDEIGELLGKGWRIALIRPITTSMAVKLKHLPPEVLKQGVYTYSLCILENKNLLLPPSETTDAPGDGNGSSMTRG